MFVGLTPRKFSGSSCWRPPDESRVVEHAWERRPHRRSPSVPDHRRAEGRWGEKPGTLGLRDVAGLTPIQPV
jgi:hypothetical protein